MHENSDVQIIQLIKTTLKRAGEGIENDPIRIIVQYWNMQGKLLFEVDTFKKEVKYCFE